jgi:hypothetical protein
LSAGVAHADFDPGLTPLLIDAQAKKQRDGDARNSDLMNVAAQGRGESQTKGKGEIAMSTQPAQMSHYCQTVTKLGFPGQAISQLMGRVNKSPFSGHDPRAMQLISVDTREVWGGNGDIVYTFRDVDPSSKNLLDEEIEQEIDGKTIRGFNLLYHANAR